MVSEENFLIEGRGSYLGLVFFGVWRSQRMVWGFEQVVLMEGRKNNHQSKPLRGKLKRITEGKPSRDIRNGRALWFCRFDQFFPLLLSFWSPLKIPAFFSSPQIRHIQTVGLETSSGSADPLRGSQVQNDVMGGGWSGFRLRRPRARRDRVGSAGRDAKICGKIGFHFPKTLLALLDALWPAGVSELGCPARTCRKQLLLLYDPRKGGWWGAATCPLGPVRLVEWGRVVSQGIPFMVPFPSERSRIGDPPPPCPLW